MNPLYEGMGKHGTVGGGSMFSGALTVGLVKAEAKKEECQRVSLIRNPDRHEHDPGHTGAKSHMYLAFSAADV